MPRTCEDALDDLFNGFSAQTFVEKPCIIAKVINQYTVDVTYYDNNSPNTLVNVPVKHLQTNSAFIFLPLKAGDCGTIRFFDNDVTTYYNGSDIESTEERTHDINDNEFTYGFYPTTKQYVFPTGDLVIGTKDGATINMTGNGITISGGDVTILGSSINIGSNVTIDGKNFLEHQHSNGNQGANTGGVV